MKTFFSRLTLFQFLAISFIFAAIWYGIHEMYSVGGATILGELVILVYIVDAIAVLILDRFLVRVINNKILSVFEFLALILCFTIYSYENRTLTIDLENKKSNFILVIENPGNLTTDNLSNKFLFDKYISTYRNYIVVDKIDDNTEVIVLSDWDILESYRVDKIKKYPKIRVFSDAMLSTKLVINQHFVDSLVSKR